MENLVIAVIAVLAFAFVLVPLFRRGARGGDEQEFATGDFEPAAVGSPVPPIAAGPATPVTPVTTAAASHAAVIDDDVEAEVRRYRAALRAGTLCPRCGEANPPDSAFCGDCGRRLPLADAREFE